MRDDMPDEVRRWMQESYDVACEAGLDPVWHDDADGFDYLCPLCARRGNPPHRVVFRMEPMQTTMCDPDIATGPAG